MEIKLKSSRIFEETCNANTRVVVHQGGTRSSKTYSVCQYYIIKLLRETGKILTISRKTMPSLKQSVLRDFMEILQNMEIYNESFHNKTESTYKLNGNLIEFISMDQPQKKRGAKRNYLWLNEANEFSLEDYRQLILRTENQVMLDYNPSDFYHWIYDEVLPRDDCTFIKSTYRDNPFLTKEQVREIERLKEIDPDYWKIYGQGERALIKGLVYKKWQPVEIFPDIDEIFYGLDFGYTNDVTALVKMGIIGEDLYCQNLIYQNGLTNHEIAELLKENEIKKSSYIYADSAEPKSIQEIKLYGYNIKPTKKGADSVRNGINLVKQHCLKVFNSQDLEKELKSYRWKERDGKVLTEPIDMYNHSLDAIRYALTMKKLKKQRRKPR